MHYRPAPGLEIARLGDDDRFLLRSDFVALELSGETAALLVEQVLERMDRPLTAAEIAERLPGYRRDSLEAELGNLVRQGVLVVDGGEAPAGNAPFAALLDEIGLGAVPTLARLSQATVAVMGLEAHGAHVARLLADAGVGRLVLADPFPFEPAHRQLTQIDAPDAIGANRELAVARRLARDGLELQLSETLDRAAVARLVEGCQLVIACWDRGFHAAHHWANEAALEHGVPALFSELRATSSFAGPLLLPGRSACWMCYRMRTLAGERDFDLAMSLEEHLDRKRKPALAGRPVLPVLPAQLAATLALEAIKLLIKLHQPALADAVLEFDGLASESRMHPVLVVPECPSCSKKAGRRGHPTAAELLGSAPASGKPIHELADRLVSSRTGVVVDLSPALRDATEPPRPLVWRARLSNRGFLSEPDDSHMIVSGKGMTRAAAWTSCLGEAVERYSGSCWDPDETVVCRRDELDGRSLDPRELVLFAPDQYASLPYSPYREEAALRWVTGRSLVTGDEVWIPAIGVFMDYHVADEQEFLCPVTSNGLAAGPTLRDAVLGALYEVLERDAFLIAWMNRLPGRRLDARRHADADVRRLARWYGRRGVELALYELPGDTPVTAVAAIAFQAGGYGGPYATVGLGADADPAAAARAAALEVGQVRPAFRARARGADAARIAELVADPAKTTTLEDHALLYADPSMAAAFEFLDGGRAAPSEAPEDDPLALLVEHFRGAAQELLYVNLTPPDMEALGLYTARAVVPGFQPIWFGDGERRLGGSRLYELPWRLGLRDAPADRDSLNPLPHPLA